MEDFNYWDYINNQFQTELVNQQNEVVRKAITDAGFDFRDKEFMKANFQLITAERDPFYHLYYHHGAPDMKRIISMERLPAFTERKPGDDFKLEATIKYY